MLRRFSAIVLLLLGLLQLTQAAVRAEMSWSAPAKHAAPDPYTNFERSMLRALRRSLGNSEI